MKPNILFMISHDSGRKLHSYGYKVDTPALDELARNGTQFNNYYCCAPQCSPSRGSILTGLYPHNNGLIGLAHLGFSIDEKHTTLPSELRKHHYETTLIGLSHETIGSAPPIEDRVFSSTYALGYDHFIPVQGDRALKVADEVVTFLDAHKAKEDQPFYLNVGFFETHRDFDEYKPYADAPENVEVFKHLPDNAMIREDISLFNGSMKVLDQGIDRIMNKLKACGLDKNTIVIFTTDHGVAFPGAKGTLKNSGLETALIVAYPKNTQKGKQKNALLCNVDLLPTILDMIEVEIPDQLDGISFASLLREDTDNAREDFFTEMSWHDQYHPMRGIRSDKYSYVKNFEDGPKIYITVDSHLSLSGESVREEYYVPNEPEEFYDLVKDPLEVNNIIHHPDYQDVVALFRKKVEDWMISTKDPLLDGPIQGVESSRWKQEIASGRAYPGKQEYYKKLNMKKTES